MGSFARMTGLLLGLLLIAAGAAVGRASTARVESVSLPGSLGIRALRFHPDGKPVGTALLAHGFSGSKETLFVLGEALAEVGFEGVALDFPGHGETTARFQRGSQNVEALAQAAQALGTIAPTIAVGHSMGGYALAEAIAARSLHPRSVAVLGALPRLDGAQPVLAVVGAHDELLSAEEARAWSSVYAWKPGLLLARADHALEPYAPDGVAAVVALACGQVRCHAPGVVRARTWRPVGLVLLVLGIGLVWVLLPGFALDGTLPGWITGASLATLSLAAAHLGVGWCYLGTGVTEARLPTLVAVAAVALGVSTLLGRGLAGVTRRPAQVAQAGLWALVLSSWVPLRLLDARFPAMAALLALLPLAFAAFVGGRAEARFGTPAGHAAYAVVVGFLVAQWLPT
jgi:alpha/beta superfamily hydrolase